MDEAYENEYAIIFERVNLSYGLYFFIPQFIIKGYRSELNLDPTTEKNVDTFLTEVGTYPFIKYPNLSYIDEHKCFGYVINESDLIAEYDAYLASEEFEGFNFDDAKFTESEDGLAKLINPDYIEMAKGYYYEKICEYIYIGFSDGEEENKILMFDIEKLNMTAYGINTLEVLEETLEYGNADYFEDAIDIELEEDDNHEITFNGNVVLGIDTLKDIVGLKKLSEIKNALNNIVDRYEEGVEAVKQSLNQNIDPRQAIIEKNYMTLMGMDTLEGFREYLSIAVDTYLEYLTELNKDEYKTKDTSVAKSYLTKIVNRYKKALKEEDLEKAKKMVTDVYKMQMDSFKDIEKSLDKITDEETLDIDVKDMIKFFDERVIGQDDAKRSVISAIKMNSLCTDPASKTSCLIIGPTGSGKTLLAKTASEYLNLPMIIIDSTQLTVPGYGGANLEDFIIDLIDRAGGDIDLAEKGIVVFDEIDKKGSESNADISGRGVLNTILPFVQGTTYSIVYHGRQYSFNTANLTCMATGAFTNVANKVNKDAGYNETKIGFNSSINVNSKDKQDIEYKKIKPADLNKYGGIPEEFTGRFPVIAQLKGHTVDSLIQVMLGKFSVLNAEKDKLAKLGVELEWTEDFLTESAKRAIELKTGARSIKTIVEESIDEGRWAILKDPELYEKLIITGKTVNDPKNYELILKSKNKTKKYKKKS